MTIYGLMVSCNILAICLSIAMSKTLFVKFGASSLIGITMASSRMGSAIMPIDSLMVVSYMLYAEIETIPLKV